MKQNYETLDTFSLTPNEYIRASKLKDEQPCHCVVSFYKQSGSQKCDDLAVTLAECHHFIGQTAEYDAMSYFCLCVPEMADDVSIKSIEDCKSYCKERDYYFTPEKQLQEDKARASYAQAREAAKSRTAHLRH